MHGAELGRVGVEDDVEVLLLAHGCEPADAALQRRPVVGAGAVLADTPDAGLGGEEQRLVAGRVAGRPEEHHAVSEREVAFGEDDVLRVHAELAVADEPRALERMKIVPVLPFVLRREELRVRESSRP